MTWRIIASIRDSLYSQGRYDITW